MGQGNSVHWARLSTSLGSKLRERFALGKDAALADACAKVRQRSYFGVGSKC